MTRERVISYVKSLDLDALRHIAVVAICHMIITDDVHFPSDAIAPYWESCGDRLDGSDEPTFPDEEAGGGE